MWFWHINLINHIQQPNCCRFSLDNLHKCVASQSGASPRFGFQQRISLSGIRVRIAERGDYKFPSPCSLTSQPLNERLTKRYKQDVNSSISSLLLIFLQNASGGFPSILTNLFLSCFFFFFSLLTMLPVQWTWTGLRKAPGRSLTQKFRRWEQIQHVSQLLMKCSVFVIRSALCLTLLRPWTRPSLPWDLLRIVNFYTVVSPQDLLVLEEQEVQADKDTSCFRMVLCLCMYSCTDVYRAL